MLYLEKYFNCWPISVFYFFYFFYKAQLKQQNVGQCATIIVKYNYKNTTPGPEKWGHFVKCNTIKNQW